MGASWELLAFVFRILQTRHQDNVPYATAHTILYLLAPLCTPRLLASTPRDTDQLQGLMRSST